MKVPLGLMVRGGLVCGIPVEAVTNSCLRTSPVAALDRRSPLGIGLSPFWFLVVVCNVTSVLGDISYTSLEREDAQSVECCVGTGSLILLMVRVPDIRPLKRTA